MRFTAVRTLADAAEIVRLADQSNAGILPDLLHVVRSGTTLDELGVVEPALFPYAQWCDAPAEPASWDTRGLVADALDDRSIPGEGELQVTDFEDLFDVDVPFSIEVRSKALREAFPAPVDRARHLLAHTQAAIARGITPA